MVMQPVPSGSDATSKAKKKTLSELSNEFESMSAKEEKDFVDELLKSLEILDPLPHVRKGEFVPLDNLS